MAQNKIHFYDKIVTITTASLDKTKPMENLVLVNRQKRSVSIAGTASADEIKLAKSLDKHAQWKTCLRTVYFMHINEFETFPVSKRDAVYVGEQAYRFLLEVLCGLQSPMVGETEVLGQFKEFLKAASSHELVKREKTFFNHLLKDCKTIRERHLQQLGCHSYGSLTRRLLKNIDSVSFVGAGQLVREILPWLKEKKSISIFSRDGSRLEGLKEVRQDLRWFSLQAQACEQQTSSSDGKPSASYVPSQAFNKSCVSSEALVVCAPMSNQELLELIQNRPLQILLDLRGEFHFEKLEIPMVQEYHSLNQFMDSIRVDRAHTELKVQEAKNQILDLVEEKKKQAILRPLGWEDLWA